MKCENASDLFSEYVAGEVEPALCVSLENHLAVCEECRTIVAELRTLWNTLDTMPVVEPPLGFHNSLMSQVVTALDAEENAEAQRRATWNWRSAFKPRALAYAASILALALVGAGGLHLTRASLDPLGSLINVLHPMPGHVLELTSPHAEWAPNPEGSGTLVVHLKALTDPNYGAVTVHCAVKLPAELVVSGATLEADVNSTTETTLRIPMSSVPASEAIAVTLTKPGAPHTVGAKTEPVTLMMATDKPTN